MVLEATPCEILLGMSCWCSLLFFSGLLNFFLGLFTHPHEYGVARNGYADARNIGVLGSLCEQRGCRSAQDQAKKTSLHTMLSLA
ncbi:MAG: hypothetical protein JWN63_1303 [Candidatus Acidoferrum typicum]|nr:hypothetical protein [Candidatus Acidoferrum typicum]